MIRLGLTAQAPDVAPPLLALRDGEKPVVGADSAGARCCTRCLTGTRIANRLRYQARRLLDADKKAGAKRRGFDQCLADALDEVTGYDETGSAGADADAAHGTSAKPAADICVMVHVDGETARLVAELPDRTRIPRSVLDALSCDAAIAGLICDRQGSPIWRSYASRGATDTQRQILFATYGGCFHCGANPGICQIHHIEPVWIGGKTEINNLVPLCWGCHNLIHEHSWWILKRTLGHHTMHPPGGARHGPAREPDHQVLHRHAGPACGPGLHPNPPPDNTPNDSARNRRGPPSHDSAHREPALF